MVPHSGGALAPLVGCSGLSGDFARMDLPTAAEPLLASGFEAWVRGLGGDDMNVPIVAVRPLHAGIRV
jgi:hypothetical protein